MCHISSTKIIQFYPYIKQEHPRGSIVEPQCIHQDGLNFLSNNGLNSQLSLHMCMTFLIAKEKKLKLELVRTLLRITRLAYSELYLVTICPNAHEKWTKSEIRSSWIRTLLRNTSLTHKRSCLIISYTNSHEKLTKSEIRSSWTRFEYCSESLFVPIQMESRPKVNLRQVGVGSNIAQNHSSSPLDWRQKWK